MTCCKNIDSPSTIDFTSPNHHTFLYHFDQEDIRIIINVCLNDIYFLKIETMSNFLSYDPERFRIYNRSLNIFETPIGDAFMLLKEWSYDIYNRNNVMFSLQNTVDLIWRN
jgi:hypothetical protein